MSPRRPFFGRFQALGAAKSARGARVAGPFPKARKSSVGSILSDERSVIR